MKYALALAFGFDGVIVPAPADAQGPKVGLVYVHGAKCEPKAYMTAMQWLQQEVKQSIQLTVALPLFSSFVYPDAPLPFLIDSGVDAGFAELQKSANLTAKFLAGHSMGGAMAPMYKKASELQGMITLGAYLTRSFREKGYPIPALQVGGELDGGAGRVARMAEQFHAYFPGGYDAAQAQKNPVVVVPGMSHAQFLSGPAPAEVVKSDLIPDITTVEAHKQLATVMGAFIRGQVLQKPEPALEQWVQQTEALVSPYVEALRLEGFPYLTKVGETTPMAVDGSQQSPWTQTVLEKYASAVTAGGVKVNVTTSIRGFDFEHQHPKPELQADGALLAPSASNNYYNLAVQKVDVQYGPLATSSLGWKFLQLDWLMETAKLPVPKDLHQPTCQEINQYAIDYALAHLPKEQMARHQKYGDALELLNDTGVTGGIGPLWCVTGLKVGTDAKDHATTVQGVVEASPTHGHLPFPGAFYCKTLSPGYAMELLSTETIRRQRALKTDPTHDNSDPGPSAAVLV
jgi:hypothetical protein